jgi:predicted RNase H-like nuclease
LKELVQASPWHLVGRSLKRLEDRLDAVILAYLAAYYYRWGLDRCMVVGGRRQGYIVTVRPPGDGRE